MAVAIANAPRQMSVGVKQGCDILGYDDLPFAVIWLAKANTDVLIGGVLGATVETFRCGREKDKFFVFWLGFAGFGFGSGRARPFGLW